MNKPHVTYSSAFGGWCCHQRIGDKIFFTLGADSPAEAVHGVFCQIASEPPGTPWTSIHNYRFDTANPH